MFRLSHSEDASPLKVGREKDLGQYSKKVSAACLITLKLMTLFLSQRFFRI